MLRQKNFKMFRGFESPSLRFADACASSRCFSFKLLRYTVNHEAKLAKA